jgi:hypothetical protein
VGKGVAGSACGGVALAAGCSAGGVLTGLQPALSARNRAAMLRATPGFPDHGFLICVLRFINSLLWQITSYEPPNQRMSGPYIGLWMM